MPEKQRVSRGYIPFISNEVSLFPAITSISNFGFYTQALKSETKY